MIRQAQRFGSYVPKSSIRFDPAGKHLLFSYDDENSIRDGLGLLVGAQGSFLSYYYFFYKSAMSLVGFSLAAASSVGLVIHAKNTPAYINLLQDGKSIELQTYTSLGKVSKKVTRVPIGEIQGRKGRDGLKILWNDRVYLLNQEGKIHNPELLYAVLRGLDVETQSKFK